MTKEEKDLENFLIQNPQLISYQRKLDKELSMCQEHERVNVIARHITYNLDELSTEFRLLQLKLLELSKAKQDLQSLEESE